MKRFYSIIFSILFANIISANENFVVTKNYQENNAKNYEGELLVVIPLPEGESWYWYFMEPELFSDDFDSENSYNAIYCKHHLGKFGTEPSALVNKKFIVTEVKQMRYYTHRWIFYMTNIEDPKDKVKFIYHGDKNFLKGSPKVFPFLTYKYVAYLTNKLYNKNIYVSTVKQTWANTDSNFGYKAYCRYDINGNLINYDKPYAKYKVTDLNLDPKTGKILLTLTDGNITTTELYVLYYEPDGGLYNTCAKIFTEQEWTSLYNIYGEEHLTAIMAGDIINGMTYKECILSHGQPKRHNTENSEYNEFSWIFGKQYKTFKFDKSGNMISETTSKNDVISAENTINDVVKYINKYIK